MGNQPLIAAHSPLIAARDTPVWHDKADVPSKYRAVEKQNSPAGWLLMDILAVGIDRTRALFKSRVVELFVNSDTATSAPLSVPLPARRYVLLCPHLSLGQCHNLSVTIDACLGTAVEPARSAKGDGSEHHGRNHLSEFRSKPKHAPGNEMTTIDFDTVERSPVGK